MDMIGSDDDTLSGPEDFNVPINEDSYQGQPNPALDGKSGALEKIRLDEPLDFGFLLQNPKAESTPVLDPTSSFMQGDLLPSFEIAKTLELEACANSSATSSTNISTPTTTTPPPERSHGGRSRGKTQVRKRRERERASTEPDSKKAKANSKESSDTQGSPLSVASTPMSLHSTGNAPLNASRMHANSLITEVSEMPEATEEEWQHRIDQRIKCIELGRQTPEYKKYLAAIPKEARGEGAPMTPDPNDRNLSKRQWKVVNNEWRKSLKDQFLDV